ncbi:MAG: VWA domain-containing protein, partial [Myxococcota bacterium]
MSEFRFAEPAWIHLLWGVLTFTVLLFWLERRGGGALSQLVSGVLQDRLVRRPTLWRRRARIVLLGLAGVCLVLALMRPQLGIRHVAVQRVGAQIMIALDVSKSMLAEDVAPNRLDRAKAEIVDLLGYLDGDQVGLIAFAGRATVVSPLTPDFSFLRLVLDGVGPHTIARGGTRLEEPIRKAVEGFGVSGDASRAILLITDGEDHDSFPLDAAKAAAEAGVIIIAIGFGDEAGSEIYLTDRETGARQLIRDADGRPVRSRLDGDLLRDLAMATGGAYVPAGTGVLDLESIYRQHIQGLMVGQLDPRGRTVRDEAYQWAVLVALIFLVSSVVITSGTAGAGVALALLIWVSSSTPVSAEQSAPNDSTAAAANVALDGDGGDSGDTAGAETDDELAAEPETPREVYNLGVAALEREDFDAGARHFERARREAADDGELRFAASYDLALAFARRAGQLEAESPAEALQAYYTAADWFRDAIAQRPEHEDSRANLEVALRSALLVADRLARKPEGIQAALEELAGSQRELVGDLAGLLQLLADDPDIFAADRLRREFRVRATSQRAQLSDGDRLAREIDTERELIANKSEEERTPEDQMRAAQFEAVLHYLHRAREKMGQARRQLRQRQGGRAYRRGSDALDELKRALDQLRNPAQLLEVLIRDAKVVASGTGMLTASRRGLPGAAAAQKAPVWLTAESLQLDQQQVVDRIQELDQRLLAGLQQEPGPDPAAEEMLASVRDAEPFVASAQSHFEAAVTAIESTELSEALPSQLEGIVALGDARERFLDLSGLIEATYTDEKRIGRVLSALGEQAAAARDEFLPTLREVQQRNIDRAERLEAKLKTEAAKPRPPEQTETDPDADAIRAQRFELAGQLLTLTLAQMDEVQLALGSDAGTQVSWSRASEAAAATIGYLESLRRLFLSITEQLRDA